jgi:membrane peptidoglycan carboxypeptidase
MEQVVERGTARAAQIDGYTIAGKTGTASKIIDGRYSKSEYNASFVGFIPSRQPALTVIVVIDSPHGNGYTGGVVAAPVFKRIAEASLRQLGIAPTVNPLPPVLAARHEQGAEPAVQRDGGGNDLVGAALTPLQMVTAVSSVANGGHLLQPRVVRAFIKDGRRIEVPHKEVRRTIEPDTAATLTAIMEQVVERGTARAAQIDGYTIAGKTGTAAKLVNGHYQTSDYNASFVGFVPSRNPALAILVVIDSPHGNGHTGGAVSAPVFRRIAEASLTYLGVGPNLDPPATVIVARRGADADTPSPQPAKLATEITATLEPARNGLMPDLRGFSAREAIRLLSRIGMTPRLTGDGFVVEQDPMPGAALVRGEACRLTLGRSPIATGGRP